MLAIAADSSGAIVVVGKRGTVLKLSENGKETWTKVPIPTTVDLTAVGSLPSGMLLVLGRDRLLTSISSGVTWITHGPYKWDTLSGLAFENERTGFMSAGMLLLTTDGGKTLAWLPLSRTPGASQVRISDEAVYFLIGSAATGSTVRLPGEKLPSHSEILKSVDMGKKWQSVFQMDDKQTHKALLEDLFFLGEYGWAVGAEGTVVCTTDGGKSWQVHHIVTSAEGE